MKFATVLTTLAVVFSATYAAECTQSQLESAGSLPEITKFQSACAGLASLGGSTSLESVKKICENTKCLDAMKAASKAFPKCEMSGMSLSATLSAALSQVDEACEKVGSPSTSTTTAPAASSAASSAATSVGATVAAVVTAVYTYTRV